MSEHMIALKNKNNTIGKVNKIRADQLLVEQGLAESREQAKRYIMAGLVTVGTPPLRVEKAGFSYRSDTVFQLIQRERFVSRGAYKLLTALEYFSLSVENLICLDAGASTGGFSDCLLQHNAKKIYAVDVGHGQLHEKLLNDERVINLERTNLRYVDKNCIPEKVDLIVADVSFISLTQILPPCLYWLKETGKLVTLIKPQFELGPHRTIKGVVVDVEARQEAVDKIINFCQLELNLNCVGTVPAAIKGPKGNQEFLALFEFK